MKFLLYLQVNKSKILIFSLKKSYSFMYICMIYVLVYYTVFQSEYIDIEPV